MNDAEADSIPSKLSEFQISYRESLQLNLISVGGFLWEFHGQPSKLHQNNAYPNVSSPSKANHKPRKPGVPAPAGKTLVKRVVDAVVRDALT